MTTDDLEDAWPYVESWTRKEWRKVRHPMLKSLVCRICHPNLGCNATRRARHGTKRPKYKFHRRS